MPPPIRPISIGNQPITMMSGMPARYPSRSATGSRASETMHHSVMMRADDAQTPVEDATGPRRSHRDLPIIRPPRCAWLAVVVDALPHHRGVDEKSAP